MGICESDDRRRDDAAFGCADGAVGLRGGFDGAALEGREGRRHEERGNGGGEADDPAAAVTVGVNAVTRPTRLSGESPREPLQPLQPSSAPAADGIAPAPEGSYGKETRRGWG